MDPASVSNQNILRPPAPTGAETVWSRRAQLAAAFLLGMATAGLIFRGVSGFSWGSRPTDLERPVVLAYRIDLNRASHSELLQLPGVGAATASRIELHREEVGGFRSLNELLQVRGIGPATLERIRPWISVDAAYAEASPQRTVGIAKAATQPGKPRTVSKKEANLKEPIDVNLSSIEDLQRLPGIGPRLSQRIVDERSKSIFKSVEDLRRVSGIGPKILERLRPHVIVGGDPIRLATIERPALEER